MNDPSRLSLRARALFLGRWWIHLGLLVANTAFAAGPADDDAPAKTRNVVIVTFDGFRWQEFFSGAEEGLMEKDAGGVRDRDALRRRYLRDSSEERREALLPFIWGTIARQGQVFGDPSRRSSAVCTNGMKFSYPGYNELFCGFGDKRITSNSKRDNPDLSVLEFLDGRPTLRGRIAAFCTWDVFPFIFRQRRNGLKVQAGWTPIVDEPLSDRQRFANELITALPHYWPDNTFDVVAWQGAREHLLRHRPRTLYLVRRNRRVGPRPAIRSVSGCGPPRRRNGRRVVADAA